jgi:16S rRNA G966 N2-methylase RsmD
LLGLIGDTARLRLLDVAAGTGVVAVEAARRGAEVLATDFAPGMVEVMRRRFAAEGLSAQAEVMDGQALTSWCTIDAQPCPSGLFDWWGYRSAQRSDTSPAMASMVSSKCSRRPM